MQPEGHDRIGDCSLRTPWNVGRLINTYEDLRSLESRASEERPRASAFDEVYFHSSDETQKALTSRKYLTYQCKRSRFVLWGGDTSPMLFRIIPRFYCDRDVPYPFVCAAAT